MVLYKVVELESFMILNNVSSFQLPEVGSSQNIKDGFVNTSAAKDNLLNSPPEIPFNLPSIPMHVFSHFDKLIYFKIKDPKNTFLQRE